MELAKTKQQQKFWDKLQPVNRVATTDTYKRTMSGSSDLFALNEAVYNLAARRPFKEEGVNGRMIMAGLEKILYPWFKDPITKEEVTDAKDFFTTKGQVKKFPEIAWQKVLDNEGFMPIDIYALPGGQTFLAKDGKHVPLMSVEGTGAIVSHLEPQMLSLYGPIIQATKSRLFFEEVGERFAEFGLRSDELMNNHVTLMMALYVGGGFSLTSDDQAAYLFPDYFKDIGTMGHEMLMAYQKKGFSLEEAQEAAFDAFVAENDVSALLPDIASTRYSGLPAVLKQIQKNVGNGKIIKPRFDSGDVTADTVYWKQMTEDAGFENIGSVVEDGYSPSKAKETQDYYESHGHDKSDIVVGSGGYFRDGCTRDAISLAYKRSATMHGDELEESMKFSDTPGKRSIPGKIRIYGKDDVLIVAQAGENIDGEFLMKKVVENGRYIYDETLDEQHKRAQQTWDQYTKIEYSPQTQALIDVRLAERNELVEKYALMEVL